MRLERDPRDPVLLKCGLTGRPRMEICQIGRRTWDLVPGWGDCRLRAKPLSRIARELTGTIIRKTSRSAHKPLPEHPTRNRFVWDRLRLFPQTPGLRKERAATA